METEPTDVIFLYMIHQQTTIMKFRILIKQEDGVFISEVPELPGCVSQGNTREDAVANIKDAISGYVSSLKKHDEPIPLSIDEEIVEVHL